VTVINVVILVISLENAGIMAVMTEVSDEAEVIVINVATLVILPESVGKMAVTIVTVVVEEAFMSVIVPTADPLNVGQLKNVTNVAGLDILLENAEWMRTGATNVIN